MGNIEMQNDKVRQHAKQTEDFELQKALMETQNSERGKALETMRSKMKQEQTKSAKVGAEIARLEGAIRASERERERVCTWFGEDEHGGADKDKKPHRHCSQSEVLEHDEGEDINWRMQSEDNDDDDDDDHS